MYEKLLLLEYLSKYLAPETIGILPHIEINLLICYVLRTAYVLF